LTTLSFFALFFSGHFFSPDKLVVGKLQVMVLESKAELWDSITYFATTTDDKF
jgi:hypothetical protein